MNENKIADLLPLHALGALDPAEIALVEGALGRADDAPLARDAEAFAGIVHLWTLSTIPRRSAPAGAKSRLLRRLNEKEAKNKPWGEEHSGFKFVRANEGRWVGLKVERGWGRMQILFRDRRSGFNASLLEFGPDSVLAAHHHSGEEIGLLLVGDLVTHGVALSPGDFFRAAPDSDHGKSYTRTGCRLLILARGH